MNIAPEWYNNRTYNMQDAFGAADITSVPMRKAISDWFGLYYNKTPTETEDPCQQIPFTIVRKLTKTVFAEYTASSGDQFVQLVLDSLDPYRKQAVELALIGGECLLKPIPLTAPASWRWTAVSRDDLLVFERDHAGRPSDIGITERTVNSRYYYTLLERRTVDSAGYLTIHNRLYRALNAGNLGQQVPLNTLEQYAEIPDDYTFPQPVGSVGLVSVKTPVANCVDGGPDGVSVYAAAVGLIHNINRNEAQLNGEFDRGESRIIASADLLRKGRDGERRFEDHLFVGLDDDPDSVGVTIFSPALREQSFLSRKQEYLRNVESVIGLKRGLLSEVEAVERTAKEITSSEGDYNLTIIDFQEMWDDAVKEAVRLCGVLGQMYRVPGAHEPNEDSFSIDWGNGVLYDEDKTWADYLDMVARGLLKPEIAIGWRFGMTTETPEDLAAIREKYMPELSQMAEDGEE